MKTAKPSKPLRRARVRIDYTPAGQFATNLKGRVLRVVEDAGFIVELAFEGRRIWFTRSEIARA
jgi:hypothetical protein